MFQATGDKLIMQVSDDFSLTEKDKDLADRMLKVYNKRIEQEIAERKRKNDRILKLEGKKPWSDK